MSTKYPGGFITKSPVAPTTTAASGIWTLDQQQQAQKAGTWPSPPIFIEDLFSTYLYTGNGSTQTITNGIDLAGKGGLVWLKNRTGGSGPHNWYTTAIGSASYLDSSQTSGLVTYQEALSTYNSDGFSLSSGAAGGNENTFTYASWTFRKQPKFFDVVTYTGTGSVQNISHNLGSVPGCIIVKSTTATEWWAVQHRSLGATKSLYLNSTNAEETNATNWNNTSPTSTQFTVGTNTPTNLNGATFVAYLFAHDAGGFPVSGGGSTNGISCGSFTTDGSGNATINLGYEPQWLLQKSSSTDGNWFISDVMRGMPVSSNAQLLRPNLSTAESAGGVITPTATGFTVTSFLTSTTYIYIAIRRGPMKPPTVGTSVFLPSTAPATTPFNVGFPPDLALWSVRDSTGNKEASVRLQGGSELFTNSTAVENSGLDIGWASKTNFWYQNVSGGSIINWLFRRAPGFCDVVCYTGTSSARTITHNLAAVPELMIVKCRSTARAWPVYAAPLGNTEEPRLNESSASGSSTSWNSTTPTSSVFSVSNASIVNASGDTYVAYLFATVAGVSKVGSYTGTGALQTVNCGFTSGARFVLIKRTDSTGDWWTYDSARGITAGNDPYLYLNTTDAEVTGTNYVDTDTTGFKVTAAAPAGLNANGGTFIFLAIA